MLLGKLTLVGSLLSLACTPAAASAEGRQSYGLSLNGFGTLGVVHSSEKNADFVSSILKPSGAGYTRDWSADPDTRVGVQATARLGERWEAVLQMVSEQQHDNSYRPHVEWANVKVALSTDFDLRVGRIAVPAFLAGDYRKVGYALPWVRPPGEVYGLNPVTNNDGLDAAYRFDRNGAMHTLQMFVGRKDVKAGDGITAEARDSVGVAHTLEAGPLTTRAYYQQARLTIGFTKPLFDAFRQFGAEGNAIADRYDSDNKRFRIAALGATYDAGRWFASGEIAKTWPDSWMGNKTAWYAGGGYAFGKVTPYIVFARVKANTATSTAGLTTAGMPPAAAAAAAGLNTELNTLLGYTSVQKTVSIGARWDVARNAALKVQYDYTDIGAGSPGSLINLQPGFQSGGDVQVFSVVFDFVF